MAIIIERIDLKPFRTGVVRYRLKIGTKVITEFRHRRERGLAACLRDAADAIDRERWRAAVATPEEDAVQSEVNE